MAGSLFSMANLARIAKVIALLLFVLPWVTISCAEQPLVTMSGVDLATGHVMMHNPMTGATESPPGANGGDIWVILAALLILAGLAASFVLKGRNGLIANMAGAGAGRGRARLHRARPHPRTRPIAAMPQARPQPAARARSRSRR